MAITCTRVHLLPWRRGFGRTVAQTERPAPVNRPYAFTIYEERRAITKARTPGRVHTQRLPRAVWVARVETSGPKERSRFGMNHGAAERTHGDASSRSRRRLIFIPAIATNSMVPVNRTDCSSINGGVYDACAPASARRPKPRAKLCRV